MDIDNYSYDFESRKYLRPETSRDEQLGFIDELRDIQAQNNQQIETQTHNLGRDLTPNLGGLGGSEGYFQQRYQTPQTNALVSNLKAAAQLSALNSVLGNMQSQAKQRYQKAQRDYQKRQYDKANTPTTNGGVDETETMGGYDVLDQDIYGATAPAEGYSDTSYIDVDGNWVTVYSDGTKYVNGVSVDDWEKMADGGTTGSYGFGRSGSNHFSDTWTGQGGW